MYDKFVVAYVTENMDLYTEQYDTHEEALAFVESNNDKAIIIRIEHLNELGAKATTIVVEDHT